ncbi:MAG: ABC transporter permease [Candidatus Promineifilaceae bacterium]
MTTSSPPTTADVQPLVTASQSFWQTTLQRLKRDRLTMAALIVLAIIAFSSAFAGVISTNLLGIDDPNKINILATFEGPSREHWLGTDGLGRDQLSRLLYGGRVSLQIGLFGTVFTLLFGITLGMVAAYFGRWIDDAVIWIINTLSAIPGLFLLLVVGSLFELSPLWLSLLFGLLGWPTIARLVRGTVFSLREQEYVLAARSIGQTNTVIMFKHILPNVIPIVTIATMRRVGVLILSESSLSFLGFGVRPPTSTWGTMLTKAQQFILIPNGRHLVWAPGVMITITVLCLYIIGDGLRDAMDPRLNRVK